MLNQLGLGYFVYLKSPTYSRSTLDFLSPLEVNINMVADNQCRVVTFRMFNIDYSSSISQISKIYKLPPEGDKIIPKGIDVNIFWIKLTGEGYLSAMAKSSLI